MKKTMKQVSKQIVAVFLVASLLVTFFSGCSVHDNGSQQGDSNISQTVFPTSTEKQEETITPTEEVISIGHTIYAQNAPMQMSDNWEDYIGFLDVFVYGLIATDLGNHFDVFPAEVDLSDGREVYGIAYTDYAECYTDEEGKDGFASAGFLSCIGDDAITQEEFDAGLEIENLEVPDESFSYLLAYRSEPFTSHCVVYGQYLIYGIDDEGSIFYKNQPYKKEECDESLGALYSYDESRFLYDPNVGNFLPVTGDSLTEKVDFAALEKEINDVLAEQDKNFVTVDKDQCIAISQKAVKSYLLSLQEETFLGYDVKSLVELAEELDPRECFRITDEGFIVLTAEPVFREASALMKWLVGASTGVVFIVAGVGAMAAKTCPLISASFGAIAGTAVEIFMQVVVENADIRDINWDTVSLAAVTGAISGFLYPYVGAFDKFSYKAIDSLLDATLGGAERVLRAKLNGADWEASLNQFGTGFVIALGLSVGVKALAKVVGGAASKIPSGRPKTAQTGVLSKLRGSISNKLTALQKKFDASIFHSENLARKHILGQIDTSVKALSGSFSDMEGNALTKSDLAKLAQKAENGAQIGEVIINGETRPLVKWNNTVTADFTEDAIEIIQLGKGKLVNKRYTNYNNAAEELIRKYQKDPGSMPKAIRELLSEAGYDIGDISKTKFVEIIQKSDYVFHECADMTTVMIINRAVHEQFRHAGGYSVAKAFEIATGKYSFTKLSSVATLGGVSFSY